MNRWMDSLLLSFILRKIEQESLNMALLAVRVSMLISRERPSTLWARPLSSIHVALLFGKECSNLHFSTCSGSDLRCDLHLAETHSLICSWSELSRVS